MSEVFIIEKASQNQAVLSLGSKLLQNGIILIDGDITSEMEARVKSQIFYLLNTSQTKKISIYISSYGGSVYSGLAIYDMIEYAKKKGFIVEIICTGVAMSMGLVLLSSGSPGYRKMMTNSTAMGHMIQSSQGFSAFPDIKISYEEISRLNTLLMKILSEKTKISNIETFFERDKYLNSQECLDLGIVDVIC